MSKDSLNVREYNNKQTLLLPPSIGELLPEDHLAHVVDEAVDIIDLTPYYSKIPSVGNPSYHPALMLKIWFYGYATGVYSSRKIEDRLYTDVAFMYLAGMQMPDFKAISEFRRRHLSELKDSFVEVLQICHRLGMTKLGHISLDSKVMKGNASASNTYTKEELFEEQRELEKVIDEYFQKVNEVEHEEDCKYGDDKKGNELPKDIQKKYKRLKRLKEVVEILKEAKQKAGKNKGKEDADKINLTDVDTRFQKDKRNIIPGYRAELAVDAEEQVIVTCDVTNDQHDSTQLLPMVGEILKNIDELREKTQPLRLCADSGYFGEINLAELEKEQYKEKIDLYMPDMKYQAKTNGVKTVEDSAFHWSKFIFDSAGNFFLCPVGKILAFEGEKEYRKRTVSIYSCKECINCENFGICTKSKNGRGIWVSEHWELVQAMRDKLSTKEGRQTYGLRKCTVEPVIGNLSQNMGFKSFLLRGLKKVKGEFALMCIAHNILKIREKLKRIGMGLKEALRMPKILEASS